jgi:hypothetical protein
MRPERVNKWHNSMTDDDDDDDIFVILFSVVTTVINNNNSNTYKGKVLSAHTMKVYRWRRCLTPLMLNLGIRWR